MTRVKTSYPIYCFFIVVISNTANVDCALCSSSFFGQASPQANHQNVDSNTGTGYMMTDADLVVDCCGVVETWTANFDNVAVAQEIWFQIWRQTSGNTYELVGETGHNATSYTEESVTLTPADKITIKSGDTFGWWTSGADIVTYKSSGGDTKDDNWLLPLADKSVGDSQDWSGPTVYNSRGYAVRVDVAANNEPSFTNVPGSQSILSNVGSGLSLLNVTVSDVDTDDVSTLAVAMTAHSQFSFDTSTFELSTGTLLGSGGTEVLVFECSDQCGNTATASYTVTIVATNYPPVLVNLQNVTSVSTTSSVGAQIFNVISTDPDGDTLTYNMTCAPSPCPFQIYSSGMILVTDDMANHTTVAYDLFITVADASSSDGPSSLTVAITDINDPVVISNLPLVSALLVAENTALGTNVYAVSYTDTDTSQTHVFTMASSPTEGAVYFSIDTSSGLITTSGSVLDYEVLTNTSFTFTVTVTDGVTSDTQVLGVEVLDVNEAPVFNPTDYYVVGSEGNAKSSVADPAWGVSDPDLNDTTALSMNCGADNAYFYLGVSNRIRFQTSYDLDTGNLSSLVMCAMTATDDGGLTATASLTISIVNSNDHVPSFVPDNYIFYLNYYTPVGTVVGTTTVTDADSNAFGDMLLTLDQSSLGAEYFSIDSSGVITIRSQPEGSSALNYSTAVVIEALATDTGGRKDTATVTFVVSDLLGIDTTTAASITTTTVKVNTFLDDGRNWAWLVPCGIVLAGTLLLIGYMAVTCHGEKGCQAVLQRLKTRNPLRCTPSKPSQPTLRQPEQSIATPSLPSTVATPSVASTVGARTWEPFTGTWNP